MTASILAIAGLLLKVFAAWTERARNRDLLDAGEAAAIAKGLSNALKGVERSRALRRGVAVMSRHDVDNILRPPSKRD